MTSVVPALVLACPLLAAIWVVYANARPNLREGGSITCAVVMAGIAFSLAVRALEGPALEVVLFPLIPDLSHVTTAGATGYAGTSLHLRADPAGALFAALAAGLWALTAVYSIGYMRGHGEKKQARFYFWFAMCVFAAAGIALSANLVTFFIFFEILTFSTYPLVVHKESEEAFAGGRKYLAYTVTGGVCFLLALVWTHAVAGTTEFRPGGVFDADVVASAGAPTLWAIFGLFIIGVGVKSAVMPLHSWLPTAMVAPTPVSALLHAVAVVKAGVFGVIRIVGWVYGPTLTTELGVGTALAWAAAATILLASLIALTKDNLKARLAYSTVSQLSYIVLGAALASKAAFTGSVIHIVNHGFMKITLFYAAGTLLVHAHKTKVSELDGIGRKMPITMLAFLVAALGLAGFPPIAGFTSKWNLMQGAVEAGQPLFLGVLILSAILNVAYLVPIPLRAFLIAPPAPSEDDGHGEGHGDGHENAHHGEPEGEAPFALVFPLTVTAIVSLVIGIWPDLGVGFLSLAEAARDEVFTR